MTTSACSLIMISDAAVKSSVLTNGISHAATATMECWADEKCGVESAQWAAARLEVREERKIKKCIILRTICRNEQFIRNRS